jgi:uncharacterized protein (DUF433 family)
MRHANCIRDTGSRASIATSREIKAGHTGAFYDILKPDMTAEQKAALENAIAVDPAIMHGTPCFKGTRVPVQTLIDFLETGENIDGFLAVYPTSGANRSTRSWS